MADVAFTVNSKHYQEKGRRQDAVAAWKTARAQANAHCFAHYPRETVTLTVGGTTLRADSQRRLTYLVDQAIRNAGKQTPSR